MKVRISEAFDSAVFVNDNGKEEVLGLAISEEKAFYKPAEAPKQMLHGFAIDARHPFLVHIAGVPVFTASTTLPDRVKAMVQQGVPTCLFQILDTRDGAVYGVGV